MAFNIIYKIIFEVHILHDYFLNMGENAFPDLSSDDQKEMLERYDVRDFINIVPSHSCIQIMKNYHLKLLRNEMGFFIASEVKPLDPANPGSKSFTPFVPYDTKFNLSFSLIFKDPYFLSYSNLPFNSGNDKIYYFNNLAGKKGATYPSLCLPPPSYITDKYYSAGSIIENNNKLYEALINIKAEDNTAFTPNHWTEIDHRDYVTENDIVRIKYSVIDYQFNTANITQATFIIKNTQEKTVFQKDDDISGDCYKLIPKNLPDGYYTLSVSGNNGYSDEIKFYFSNEMPDAKRLAIIDLMYDDTISDDYKILNSANKELIYPTLSETDKKPVYHIILRNRFATWRYIFSKDQNVLNADLGDFVRDGDSSEKRKFLTKSPKPLTKYPIRLKKFNQADQFLPDPAAKDLKPEKDKIYCEILI